MKKIFIGFLTGLVNEFNHTTCVTLNNHKRKTHPTFISLHLNNAPNDCITIHLWSIWIDMSEGEILLMTCLIKHKFQTKQKI